MDTLNNMDLDQDSLLLHRAWKLRNDEKKIYEIISYFVYKYFIQLINPAAISHWCLTFFSQ